MHEQAIVDAVLGVVLEAAGTRPVQRVRVRVGRSLAVKPDSFDQWFEMLATETPAAGALIEQTVTDGEELAVEEIGLRDGEVLRNPDLVHVAEGEDHVHEDRFPKELG